MTKQANNLVKRVDIFGSENSDNLLLFLHGMDSNVKKIAGLIRVTEEELNPVRILVPDLPLTWYRLYDFRELARQVLVKLDEEIEQRRDEPYKRLYIIGHSAGGVLAQVIYLLSRLSDEARGLGRLEPSQIQMVLLSSINCGWQISHHLPITHKITWSIGLFAMAPSHLAAQTAKRPYLDSWLMQLHRGAPLITWLRLNWLKLGDERPLVVHLLGSRDEIVSWRDMVDDATAEQTVFYDVPYSDHAELVEFDNAKHGRAREAVFRNALQPELAPPMKNEYGIQSIEGDKINPILPWDEEPARPDANVKRVVFVIHGIRDEGHWTQKIANRARAIFNSEGYGTRDQIAVETSSYGYFSMLQFLLPWERRKKVTWLMDEYVEARRRYPNAKFSYIGHSHGTFLAAKALSIHEEVTFERIAFAGSVVNRNYPWRDLLDKGQVKSVLNFSASADWVVGIFPKLAQVKLLGFLMGPELGSAGCDPFKDAELDERVNNNEYIRGAHGAAIDEDNWDNLARFAVCNEVPPEAPPRYQKTPCFLFKGWRGWLTCFGGWLIGLFLGIYWFPKAASTAPDLFWGVGISSFILAISLVAAIHPLTRGRGLIFRKCLQTFSMLVFVAALLGVLFFWGLWPLWPPSPIAEQVKDIVVLSRIQMLSVVVYFFALWNVLTKV